MFDPNLDPQTVLCRRIVRWMFSFALVLPAPKVHAFIVGGTEMTRHDPIARSTAAIYEPSGDGRGGALCTASLIGPNTAITAAHCLEDGVYSPVMLFGTDVHDAQTERRPVTGTIVNPAWARRQGRGMDQGDIAVVKFQGRIPKGYQPAPMAAAADNWVQGETAILAGYGITNARTQEGSGVLRKTAVRVSNPRVRKSEVILDQSHGQGACHGDSGGPAYVQRNGKMVLAGVTNRSYPSSAADDCAHKVVYTKVSSYRSWIKKSQDELRRQRPVLHPLMKARVRGPRTVRTKARLSGRVKSMPKKPTSLRD
jgi:secreted trypsin-like serine protease